MYAMKWADAEGEPYHEEHVPSVKTVTLRLRAAGYVHCMIQRGGTLPLRSLKARHIEECALVCYQDSASLYGGAGKCVLVTLLTR